VPLLLTETDVRTVLPIDDLITTMESALARFSAGEVQQPVRTVLSVGPQNAFFGVMPAFVPDPPALGTKLVTLFKGNTALGLPTHLATIALFDPGTGALLAILDGRFITEARTAAVSAVTARHLASPDAGDLAILGSGVQARSHLETLRLVRPLRRVRVWSPTAGNRERFVREMDHGEVEMAAVGTPQEAVRGADLVVLATSSASPVVQGSWIDAGAHVMAVGACRPTEREMDPNLIALSRFFVDSRAAARVESGDVVLGIRDGAFDETHIAGEIGEVLLGRVRGRETRAQITVFKSLGMAVEDVAAADLAYRRARERGIGANVTLG
jgi:ornithine cyclodeaminase/alanine dehydrogenase-like protein (mu-crystallin family)